MRRADFAAVCPSFTLRLRPRPQLEVRALLPAENWPGPDCSDPRPASDAFGSLLSLTARAFRVTCL